jgi:predicted ATP-grasp superfamily ATP-dependent carboligase
MSVIVTNAKNRIAYTVVRSLGGRGIPVYAADFVPLSMSFASRFSRGHFIYPSPFRDQAGFIASIVKNARRLKAEVLIPVFEETFLLSKYKDEISRHVRMAIPDYDQVLTAHNKDRWMPLAESLGVPVPRTFAATELRRAGPKAAALTYPVLVKPNQGGGAWGIREAATERELETILSGDTCFGRPWERFSVQEKINGTVHCVAMLFSRGELKAHVVYRQLRDLPFTGGQATLRVSVDNPVAVGHLRRLLERLAWHGICQADFIVDEATGVPNLIDINPRLWGSLVQGIASGVDFPYLLYTLARDGDTPGIDGFRKGVVTRWVWGDIRTLPEALKRAGDKMGFLKEYFRLFGRKIAFDDLCFRDPLPFLTFGLDFLAKMVGQKTLHPRSHDSLEGVWE